MNVRLLAAMLLAALTIGGTACVSPAHRWLAEAAARNLKIRLVDGDSFRHVVLEKPGVPADPLHVYLDGDGTPWLGREPAPDPTPRSGLVLELMTSDPAPSVYLGRPCYHGLSSDPGCTTSMWTMQRYSPTVVSSMAVALQRLLAEQGIDRLAWIGYSGGGVLAMLLAPRFPQTKAIVTVAANLDIDAWADHHGYRRLAGSLNPAEGRPLAPHIYQRHYVGSRDRVVPASIPAKGSVQLDHVRVIAGYDHVCCWAGLWPSILADLGQAVK